MNVIFRRGDGREFVFEMPDGRVLEKLGRPFVDGVNYQVRSKQELSLVTSEALAVDLHVGDTGQLVMPGSPDSLMGATLKLIDTNQRPRARVVIEAVIQRKIESRDINSWFEPPKPSPSNPWNRGHVDDEIT